MAESSLDTDELGEEKRSRLYERMTRRNGALKFGCYGTAPRGEILFEIPLLFESEAMSP